MDQQPHQDASWQADKDQNGDRVTHDIKPHVALPFAVAKMRKFAKVRYFIYTASLNKGILYVKDRAWLSEAMFFMAVLG
jgi:hypothetical protein